MSLLQSIGSAWPLAVVALPFLVATAMLWLQQRFPTKDGLEATKTELKSQITDAEKALKDKIDATEKALSDKIDEHEERLDTGSRKMNDLDKRVAVVEEDCRAMPSRQTLQGSISELSQRMRGVEVRTEAIGEHLRTQNDYLHTLIERHLGGTGK